MKKLLLAALCVMTTACGMFSNEEETFVGDYRYFPMCSDSSDSTVVFVDVKTGDKVGKGYLGAYPFYNGSAIVLEDEGYTFINNKFEKLFNDHFKDATHFSDGLAVTVKKNEIIKVINQKGEVAFEAPYAEYMRAFCNGYAVFCDENDNYGVVNTKGEIVIEAKYKRIPEDVTANKLLIVCEYDQNEYETKWGVIDIYGNKIIPIKYERIEYYNGYYSVYKRTNSESRKCGLFNGNGEEVIGFDHYELCKDGKYYLFENKKGKIGWMDSNMKDIIDPTFSDAYPFNGQKLTPAAEEDKNGYEEWGFINQKGEWVINAKYEGVEPFMDNGYAIVKNEDAEYGVIDAEGNPVIKINKEGLMYLFDNYYLTINEDDELGIIKADGKETWAVKPTYELCETVNFHPSTSVRSDYVDMKTLAKTLKAEIAELYETNLDNIVNKYGISKSDFSKHGYSNARLKKINNNSYTIYVYAKEVYAWDSSYSYWSGYQYSFRGNQRVYQYEIEVDLDGRYASKRDEIKKYLQEQYGMLQDGDIVNHGYIGNNEIYVHTSYYDEIHFNVYCNVDGDY